MSIADIPPIRQADDLTKSEIASGLVPLGKSVIRPRSGVLTNQDLLALQEENRQQNQAAAHVPELDLTGTYVPGKSGVNLLNETGDLFNDGDTPIPESRRSFEPLNVQVNPLNVTISDLSAFILDEQAGNQRGAFLLKMATGITVSPEERQKFAKELLGELASDIDQASLSDSSFVDSFITQTLLVYHRLISQDLDNIINQGTSYGWFTDNGDLTTEGRDKLELAIRSAYSTKIALTGEQAEKDKVVDFFIDVALTAKKAKIEGKAQRIINDALHYLFEASPRGELLKLRLRQDVSLTSLDGNQLREALRPLLFIELDGEEDSFGLETVRGAMGEVIDDDFLWARFIPQLQEKLEISSTPYERKFSLFEKLSTRLGLPTLAASLGIAANLFSSSGNTVEQKPPSKPNKPTSAAVSTDSGRDSKVSNLNKAPEKIDDRIAKVDPKPGVQSDSPSNANPQAAPQATETNVVENKAAEKPKPTINDILQELYPKPFEYQAHEKYPVEPALVEFLKMNRSFQLSVLEAMYKSDLQSETHRGKFFKLLQAYGNAVAKQLNIPKDKIHFTFVNLGQSSQIKNQYGTTDVIKTNTGEVVIALSLSPPSLMAYATGQASSGTIAKFASGLESTLPSTQQQEPTTVVFKMQLPSGIHEDKTNTTKLALSIAEEIFANAKYTIYRGIE